MCISLGFLNIITIFGENKHTTHTNYTEMINPKTTSEIFYMNARANMALYNAAATLGPHYKFEMPNYDASLKAEIFNALCVRQFQN